MKKLAAVFILLAFPLVVQAQITGPLTERYFSIRQNGVSAMAAYGDTLWISPSLNRNIGNEADWYTPLTADSVVYGKGRVFSLALSQDTIIAGLGFNSDISGGSVPAAYGYYKSIDGGGSWEYLNFHLDPRGDGDTTFVYGGQEYERLRITVPEQSPPYKVDFRGDVIFAAQWASGLLRSTDFGQTWERIVLPPANTEWLRPDGTSYFWLTCLQRDSQGNCGQSVNKYNALFDNNLLGFSVFIDSQNRVWFGSAGGVNVSDNALTAPVDSISWRHIRFNDSADGLAANWVISIKEEAGTGRIWMTNWIAVDNRERHALVYTADGGDTFRQMLIGEKINDVGFKDGHVFATGDNGLFISPDGGETWIASPPIKSPNTFINPGASYYTVAATTGRVWIGTSEGIASTHNLGQTWEITRVDFPLSGGNVFLPNAKTVTSYAYPNPFSPSLNEFVRIKFNMKKEGAVTVRIFDYGMNLVREMDATLSAPGVYEAVWDGNDAKNRKVANAPYIYVIENGAQKISGKILVVD